MAAVERKTEHVKILQDLGYDPWEIENDADMLSVLKAAINDLIRDTINIHLVDTHNEILASRTNELAGCTNSCYNEYNNSATIDNGTCQFLAVSGDSNLDGIINVSDIVRIVEYILDGTNVTETCSADINFDGMINVVDIVTIVLIILE